MADESGQVPAPDEPCEDCAKVSGWGVVAAVAFACFAAFVAADFATGGKLTALALALLPRREVPGD